MTNLLSYMSLKSCGGCSMIYSKLFVCSRCDGTYYCSTECQLSDWPHHKEFCVPGESNKNIRKNFMTYYEILQKSHKEIQPWTYTNDEYYSFIKIDNLDEFIKAANHNWKRLEINTLFEVVNKMIDIEVALMYTEKINRELKNGSKIVFVELALRTNRSIYLLFFEK